MPNSIDERTVQMNFNNKNFEKGATQSMETLGKLKKSLNFDDSAKSLENIEKKLDGLNFKALEEKVDAIASRFTNLGIVGVQVMEKVADSAINAAKKVAMEITGIQAMTAGKKKYEQETRAVQTITNATGKSVEEVETVLKKLMKYTDETSYDFAEMVSSIGKFTSVGVDLELAEKAMEGIANEAAKSGAGVQEANRAMYNFAQALSAGYVKLIDWKSIENANMATKEFKEQLIETAIELGSLEKKGEKIGSVVSTNEKSLEAGQAALKKANKATKDRAEKVAAAQKKIADATKKVEVNYKTFNTTLSRGWLTSDVLVKTLEKYSDTSTEFGLSAFHAAQEALTFKHAIDATKDVISSGWMQSMQYLFGNLDEARNLWTKVANSLYDFVAIFSDARNELLEGWHELGGYNAAVEAASNIWHSFMDVLYAVKDAWENVFPPLTAEKLVTWTAKVRDLTSEFRSLVGVQEKLREESEDDSEEEKVKYYIEYYKDVNKAWKMTKELKMGDVGQEVKDLQNELKNADFLPKKFIANGIYNKETAAAVKKLQKNVGVKVTGAWDKATRAAVWANKEFVEVDAYRQKISKDWISEGKTVIAVYNKQIDVAKSLNNTINKSSRKSDIKALQEALAKAGYLSDKANADGIYGPETEAAVKKLQAALNVDVTGSWDEATKAAASAKKVFVESKEVEEKVDPGKFARDAAKAYNDLTKEEEKALDANKELTKALSKTGSHKENDNWFAKGKDVKQYKNANGEITYFYDIDSSVDENSLKRLQKASVKTESDLIRLEQESNKIKDITLRLQNALVHYGYLSDSSFANGIYGPETKKAVAQLQKDLGVEVTGVWDTATQVAVRNSDTFNKEISKMDWKETLIPRLQQFVQGFASALSTVKKIGLGIVRFFAGIGVMFKPIVDPITRLMTFISKMFQNLNKEASNNKIYGVVDGILSLLKPVANIIRWIGSGIDKFIDGYKTFIESLEGGIIKIDKNGKKVLNAGMINFKTFFNYIIQSFANSKIGKIVLGIIAIILKAIIDGISFVSQKIQSFVNSPIGQSIVSWINNIKNVLLSFFSWVSGIAKESTSIGDFFRRIYDELKTLPVLGNVITFLENARNAIVEFFNTKIIASGLFDSIKERLQAFIDWVKTNVIGLFSGKNTNEIATEQSPSDNKGGIFGIFKVIGDAINKVADYLKGVRLKDIVVFLLSIFAVYKIYKAIKAPIEAIKNILALPGTLKESIESKKQDLTGKFSKISTSLLTIAASVGILAGSVYALSTLSWSQLLGGVVGVVTLTALLIGASKMIGENDAKKMIAKSILMLGVSIAIYKFVKSMEIISAMSWSQLLKGVVSIATLLGIMVLAIKILGDIDDGKSDEIASLAAVTFTIGDAISKISESVKSISEMSWTELLKGVTGVGTLIAILVMAINNIKESGSSKMTGKAIAMVGIGFALLLIAKSVSKLGELPIDTLIKGVVSVGILIAELTAAISFIGKANVSGSKMVGKAVAMIAMVVSVKILANTVASLGNLSWSQILKGVVGIGALMGGLSLSIKFIGESDLTKGVSKAIEMVGFGYAIKLLVDSLLPLTSLSWESLLKGVAGIGALMGGLSLSIKFIGESDLTKGVSKAIEIVGFGYAIKLLVDSLLPLTSLSWESLLKGVAGIGALMTGLTLSLKSINDSSLGSLVGAVAIISLGIVIEMTASALASGAEKIKNVSITVLATFFSGVFSIVGILGYIIGNLRKNGLDSVLSAVPLIAIGIVVEMVAFALSSAIIKVQDVRISTLITFFAGMAVIVTLIGFVIGKISKLGLGSITAAVPLLAIGFVIQMVASSMANAISTIQNVDIGVLITFFIGISAALAVLTLVITPLSAIPITGILTASLGIIAILSAFAAGIGIIAAIGSASLEAFGTALWIIGSKLKDFNGFVSEIDFSVLTATITFVATALSSIITNLVLLNTSGALEKMVDIIGIGARLKLFSTMASDISPEAGDKAKQLINDAIEVANAVNSISLVDGASTTLTNLGSAIKLYYESIEGLGDEAGSDTPTVDSKLVSDAFTALSEAVPEEDIAQIASYASGGDNDMTKMALGITALGTALSGYSKDIGELNAGKVELANGVLDKFMLLNLETVTSSTLDAIFGLFTGKKDSMEGFAADVVTLGSAIADYGTNIGGLEKDDIDKANTIMDSIAELNNKLPTTGGFISLLTGGKKLGDFASNMSTLGDGIQQYANKVAEGDFTNIDESMKAVTTLGDVFSSLDKTGGVISWFEGGKDLSILGKGLDSLATSINTFESSTSEFKMSSIKEPLDMIEKIISFYNSIDVSNTYDAYGGNLNKLEMIGSGFRTMFIEIASIATDTVGDKMFKKGDTVLSAIESVGATIVGSIITGINNNDTAKSLLKAVANLLSDTISKINAVYSDMNTSPAIKPGEYVDDGLVKGIENHAEKVTEALLKVVQDALAAAKGPKGLDEHSPSKATEEMGEYAGEGLAKGLNKSSKKVENAAEDLADVVLDEIEFPSELDVKNSAEQYVDAYAEGISDGTDSIEDSNTELENAIKRSGKILSKINYDNSIETKFDRSVNAFAKTYAGKGIYYYHTGKFSNRATETGINAKSINYMDSLKAYKESKRANNANRASTAKSTKAKNAGSNSVPINADLSIDSIDAGDELEKSLSGTDIKLPDSGDEKGMFSGLLDGLMDGVTNIFDPESPDSPFAGLDNLFSSDNPDNPFGDIGGMLDGFLTGPDGFLTTITDAFGLNNPDNPLSNIMGFLSNSLTGPNGFITSMGSLLDPNNPDNPLGGIEKTVMGYLDTSNPDSLINKGKNTIFSFLGIDKNDTNESASENADNINKAPEETVQKVEKTAKENFVDSVSLSPAENKKVAKNMSKTVEAVNEVISSELETSPTITPVVDYSQLKGSSAKIQNQLGIDSTETSIKADNSKKLATSAVLSQINGSISDLRSGIDENYKALGTKLDSITDKFDSLQTYVSNLEIYLDSGELVGGIGPKMDNYLGKRKLATSKR